jgi:nucleotide-binding universal stress UspA family protein
MGEAAGPDATLDASGTALLQVQRAGSEPLGHTCLVVGFDRSVAGQTALRKAAEIGERLGADLHVVHAVDLSDYPVDPDAANWEQQAEEALEEERRTVASILVGYPGAWSFLALRAEPAQALMRAANQFDALMIVVGVRTPGWRHLLERLSGPSISHRLISHCHRPVLLVTSDHHP